MAAVKSHCRKEIPWAEHQLTRLENSCYYCSICGKSWVKAPRTLCSGVTVYPYWGAPEHLKTERQLKQLNLKLAPDQQPAGVVIGSNRYYLYDQGQAIPRPTRTLAQIAAFEKARAAALKVRTCTGCGYVAGSKRDLYQGLCDECRLKAKIKRARANAIKWAGQVLADPQAIILDTETTGLEGQIIEIAIIDVAGQTLLNTLVKPVLTEWEMQLREKILNLSPDAPIIPPEATAIHGITDADVVDAPTFAEVYDPVRQILSRASRIVIYNAAFDRSMLQNSRRLFHLPPFGLGSSKFECAMEAYAEYYGEWSDYHRSFTWQPLTGGNHRARGDCLACLERIKQMAKSVPTISE